MALNTYGAIKTAVADWHWAGGGVTAALVGTDFFPQMQSMMYMGHGRDVEPLRITAMVSSSTITPATGGIITISSQVDAGFLEFIELTPTTQGAKSLNYVEPWSFKKQVDMLENTASPQAIYTIEGDYVYLAPSSVGTVRGVWYEKFTALSADGDTDWIVTNAPQVYLDGCLMLACAYTQDSRESDFRAKFAAGIKGLNMNDSTKRRSGSPNIARPRSIA
jgi:hypothetical protein